MATVIYYRGIRLTILQSLSQVLEILLIQTTTRLLFKIVAKSLAELTPWNVIGYDKQLSVLKKYLKIKQTISDCLRAQQSNCPKRRLLQLTNVVPHVRQQPRVEKLSIGSHDTCYTHAYHYM